jgi:hypothetical protein
MLTAFAEGKTEKKIRMFITRKKKNSSLVIF